MRFTDGCVGRRERTTGSVMSVSIQWPKGRPKRPGIICGVRLAGSYFGGTYSQAFDHLHAKLHRLWDGERNG